MSPRRASYFGGAVFLGAVLFSLGVWRWRGETTLRDYGGILFWVSAGVCGLGGLMSTGASSPGRRTEHYTELYPGSEEIRRLRAENRQAGLSFGLLVFLAGLLPGALAALIVRYAH